MVKLPQELEICIWAPTAFKVKLNIVGNIVLLGCMSEINKNNRNVVLQTKAGFTWGGWREPCWCCNCPIRSACHLAKLKPSSWKRQNWKKSFFEWLHNGKNRLRNENKYHFKQLTKQNCGPCFDNILPLHLLRPESSNLCKRQREKKEFFHFTLMWPSYKIIYYLKLPGEEIYFYFYTAFKIKLWQLYIVYP
jgi:hypothetical protein